MEVKAVRATEENTREYGKFVCLPNLEEFASEGWRCWITEEFCMPQAARLGMGHTQEGIPYEVGGMRRHLHTKKLFAPGQGPVVIALARPNGTGAPNAADVQALRLEPGDFIAIEEGVWYDACHSPQGPAYYFFASLETPQDEGCVPLEGGPVAVCG